MARLPFGLQHYEHRSPVLASQRLINAYVELEAEGAKAQVAVLGSYGIADFVTIGTGPYRAAKRIKSVLYVVSGTGLYRVDSAGRATLLGSITGSDRAFIEGDGTNVMVVASGNGWTWNGSTFAEITDPDFPGADWLAYLDTYFIVGRAGSVYVSGNLDPTSWNALDFSNAEAAPDDIEIGIVDHRELLLLGTDSGEVWVNTGQADFPLERTSAGFFEIGCLAKASAAKTDNSVCFLASDGTVRKLDGYTPVRVSNHAVEQAIEGYANPQAAFANVWKEAGHEFYSLTFAEATWVLDLSTGKWHRRQSYLRGNWRVAVHVRAYNQELVGDSLSGKLGILKANCYTQWGDYHISTFPFIALERNDEFLTHRRFKIIWQSGVGLISGQGSDPKAMLRYSRDSGANYIDLYSLSIGKIGEYEWGVEWGRLGTARDQRYEVSISDPVPRTIAYAVGEVE